MDGSLLDPEAVEAFVRTADLRSFTRAAERLGTAQSAVSLKVKRLEAQLGRRLLERTPRQVRLSDDGARFIATARALLAAHRQALAAFDGARRRVVLGMSHHIVGSDLPLILRRLADAEPQLVLDLRVASSREVLAAYDAGALDAGIVLDHDGERRDGAPIASERFAWVAAPDFVPPAGGRLRLATQEGPCRIRAMAVEALDAAGIPWTEAFVGGGTLTIGAAVAAGLAVAAMGVRVAPAGTIDIGPRLGLPPLPSRTVVLHSAVADPGTRRALGALGEAIRGVHRDHDGASARTVPSAA